MHRFFLLVLAATFAGSVSGNELYIRMHARLQIMKTAQDGVGSLRSCGIVVSGDSDQAVIDDYALIVPALAETEQDVAIGPGMARLLSEMEKRERRLYQKHLDSLPDSDPTYELDSLAAHLYRWKMDFKAEELPPYPAQDFFSWLRTKLRSES
jgi:hypothetical protein